MAAVVNRVMAAVAVVVRVITAVGPRIRGGRNSGARRQVYGRINAMTQQEAEYDPRVITGTLLICGIPARVLIDSGATFSFVSPSLAWNINSQPTPLGFDMLVQMARRDLFYAQCEYRDCLVIVEGELIETNLTPFQLAGFDVILGMDWLFRHHAHATKLMQKRCVGFLAYVVTRDEPFLRPEDVPVVKKFIDVFLEDLPGLPPARGIEFTIDLLPSTNPISLPHAEWYQQS
ncbi:uncharacterized protein [Pyrus communis]|uniref:uncharacterized protein n=1 Tax=Pyrus communis TaxID=23211 RepID=UPI0035BF3564